MAWKGKFIGALIGFLMTRNLWGAVMGAFIGQLFDQSPGAGYGGPFASASAEAGARAGGIGYASVSEVFFRTTFELMGHVAKSDGRVSEAQISAARRLMQELRLAPNEVAAAIACFRFGKSAGYDLHSSVEKLRDACAMRHDLLRAFMEVQLRAALAGNGISLPARSILTRVAARLGMSGLEFAHMEAAQRAWQRGPSSNRASPTSSPLAACYAELEVDPGTSDPEVTKAYRRQMSRHHPDKLVANGLPESMARVAKEKTQRIQEAYEAIRTARGMR